MNKKREKLISYHYMSMFNFFMFSNEEELKSFSKEFFNGNFFSYLFEFLKKEEIKDIYPKETYCQLGKVLEYIKSLGIDEEIMPLYNKIIDSYNDVKDCDSNEIFNMEYYLKYYDFYKEKDFVCSKDYMIESIKFDYLFYSYLFLEDSETIEQAIDEVALNKFYLFSLNNLFNCDLEILWCSERVVQNNLLILEQNALLFEDDNNLSKFISENYTNPDRNKLNYYKVEYEKFKKYNNLMLEKVRKKDCSVKLEPQELEYYYMKTYLEQYIVLGEKIDINFDNQMILYNLYNIIREYANTGICNDKIKARIINLMDEFKKHYKGNDRKAFLKEYNEHLIILNSAPSSEFSFLYKLEDYKLTIKQINELHDDSRIYNDDTDIRMFLNTLKLDYKVLKSLICSNEEYGKLDINKFIYNADYILSIKRFYREIPELFHDEEIYSRVRDILTATLMLPKDERVLDRTQEKETKKYLRKIKIKDK